MTAQESLTLLACQIAIPPTTTAQARDSHLADTAAKLRERLTEKRADLVVLPELSSIDYSRAAFDQLDEIAEPLDGASFQTWAALAVEFGIHVCYGFARRDDAGTYISMAVVTPEGELAGHYDKLHLCQYGASMEKDYFSIGNGIFTFKVNGFTLSPIICYDIRFPELSRVLVLKHGVDVILHSGAYFRDPSFPTWHAFATTRALENQVFFLSLNRAGQDYGNSLFCYPWMDDTCGPQHFADRDEDFRYVAIDPQHMREARANYTFLMDRWDSYDRPCLTHP
ncbi:carbon-nitrogen hydrolase family protein [Meridianimarinicoccus sp. MJW13]|uniref:carbon-nitrogen hydrolase family protein n=1 Tax=Meridianimarinicoccus sp. MJW13 TaxID=2720031 RepID=UPI00186795B6|nr:carbon-nitrogen hydrolase family protein [Fluviibacterium sp. MJW13]